MATFNVSIPQAVSAVATFTKKLNLRHSFAVSIPQAVSAVATDDLSTF